jgi:hypothetical protein
MGRPNQATKAKRDRERLRQEWQQEKVEKRAQRSEIKKERSQLIKSGIDPDLEGIIPGPQPIREE